MIRVKVVEGPESAFGPSTFYRRLIEQGLGAETVLVPSRQPAALEVGSFGPSLLETATKGLDSALSRRRGRLVTPTAEVRRRLLSPKPGRVPRLWFTGENVRPPCDGWDLTFSFDLEGLSGTNMYCPLWWGEVNLLPGVTAPSTERLGHQMTVTELSSPRRSNTRQREGFACAFINNPEPMRLHAVRMLSRLGRVDVFGRLSGQSAGPKEISARNYRYMLCFENDVYPGYVTEKPFEAWATGCIPLWRGSDPAGYLNPEAMVNAADPGGLDALIERVTLLEGDAEVFAAVAGAPILRRPPDLEAVFQSISALSVPR